MPSDEQFKSIVLLGIAAIFAILTIVLLILTPFLPEEIVTGIIAVISSFFGIRGLIKQQTDQN
jgi:cadmium resistance protein CadD (predicted permease)